MPQTQVSEQRGYFTLPSRGKKLRKLEEGGSYRAVMKIRPLATSNQNNNAKQISPTRPGAPVGGLPPPEHPPPPPPPVSEVVKVDTNKDLSYSRSNSSPEKDNGGLAPKSPPMSSFKPDDPTSNYLIKRIN